MVKYQPGAGWQVISGFIPPVWPAFMQRFKAKVPHRKEVFTVFSIALFLTFTWSIYRLFFQVPSWLFYLNFSEILTITAYVMAFTLLESAFLLGFLVLLPIVYPRKLFAQKFVAQSSIILLVLTTGAVFYQQNVGMLKKWGLVELILFILGFLVTVTLLIVTFSYLLDRFARLKNFLDAFAERLTVFSLLYLPLSILGFAVMVIRNIFNG
jgi:hypothetical protein